MPTNNSTNTDQNVKTTSDVKFNSISVGVTSPTAKIHLPASSSSAGSAPIKFTTGSALITTPESGAFEYYGSHLYFTIGSTRYQLDQQLIGAKFPIRQSDGGFTNAIFMTSTDGTLLADCTANGALDVTLPNPSGLSGQKFTIKKIDATVNGSVTLHPYNTETIDGASTKVLSTQWSAITVQTNGTNWFVLT
jgi:hypothetical protein